MKAVILSRGEGSELMTNDRMTREIQITNVEKRFRHPERNPRIPWSYAIGWQWDSSTALRSARNDKNLICDLCFVIHSIFVIRHSSFVLLIMGITVPRQA